MAVLSSETVIQTQGAAGNFGRYAAFHLNYHLLAFVFHFNTNRAGC